MAAPSVVLVDRSPEPQGAAPLANVVQALQTQVDRDFGAVWGARARIDADAGARIPAGAWLIYIVERPITGFGVHLDRDGHPYAEVRAGADWTLAASHMLLEMIADPRGDRFMEGPRIASGRRRGPVRYLVEVCDPCRVFHYMIDGVEVSDFVTPDYYGTEGTAVDFLRKLRRPLEVRPGGFLAWQDPEDGHWHQKRPDGIIARSQDPSDPRHNPREDRDRAFPEGASRHDLTLRRRSAGS